MMTLLPLVQRLGEASADTRAAAGDEDGIACEFHGMRPRLNE
jgi:hypothetical protein